MQPAEGAPLGSFLLPDSCAYVEPASVLSSLAQLDSKGRVEVPAGLSLPELQPAHSTKAPRPGGRCSCSSLRLVPSCCFWLLGVPVPTPVEARPVRSGDNTSEKTVLKRVGEGAVIERRGHLLQSLRLS